MIQPKLAFANRFWYPQHLSPHRAAQVLNETAWASLAYGFGASGKLPVYDDDEESLIDLDKLYEDAVSLSLGVLTIDLPHTSPCTRLICNCKYV